MGLGLNVSSPIASVLATPIAPLDSPDVTDEIVIADKTDDVDMQVQEQVNVAEKQIDEPAEDDKMQGQE